MDESKILDTTTPRTLLSTLISQHEPTKTLRQPLRQISAVEKHGIKDTPESHKEENRASSRPDDSTALSQTLDTTTPRTLIAEALGKSEATKTLRVPTRQVTRLPIPENQGDKNGPVKDKVVSDDDQDIFHFQPKMRYKRIRLSDIHLSDLSEMSDSDGFADDLYAKIREIVNKKEESRQSIAEVEFQQRNEKSLSATKEKRQRRSLPSLSSTRIDGRQSTNISLAHETILEESDIVATEEVKVEKVLKQTRMNLSSLSHREDAQTQTQDIEVDENEQSRDTDKSTDLEPETKRVKSNSEEEVDNFKAKSSSHEDVVPASETDVSTDVGPLELSKLTEASKQEKNDASQTQQTEIENERVHDDTQTLEKSEDIHEDGPPDVANKDSSFAHEDTVTKETATQQSVARKRSRSEEIMDQYSPLERPTTSEGKAQKMKPVLQKRAPVRQKKQPYNLPFPKTQLTGILQHYSSMKFSKEALHEVEKLSEKYLNETAVQLELITRKRNRKTIELEDVKYLMKKRKYIRNENDFNVLVEENLPLEYREEIIPVARGGNVVYP